MFNQHASSIVGDVPPDVAQPQVWLEREADRERAEIVLREIEAAGTQIGNCRVPCVRRRSPANFDLCWNCGGSL